MSSKNNLIRKNIKDMKNKTTIILVLIIIFFSVIAAIQFYFFGKGNLNSSDTSANKINTNINLQEVIVSPTSIISQVMVEIVFSPDKKISGKVEAKNAFEALEKIAKNHNLALETKKFKYGLMVVKIGDKENSSSHFWAYSVDDKPGEIASDRYPVGPGSKIRWEYKSIGK